MLENKSFRHDFSSHPSPRECGPTAVLASLPWASNLGASFPLVHIRKLRIPAHQTKGLTDCEE